MDPQPQSVIVVFIPQSWLGVSEMFKKAKGARLGTHLGSLATLVPSSLGTIAFSVFLRHRSIVI